jgi:hypothetical protein
MKDSFESAIAVCHEFCNYIITDDDNGSILINVNEEYHGELVKRLDQLGLMEVLNVAAEPKRTRSCTFLVLEWEFTD